MKKLPCTGPTLFVWLSLRLFDDRKIYRVIEGFCVQGGLYPTDSVKYELPAESIPSIKHVVGSFSMAALNSKTTTATEFFFIPKISEKKAKIVKSLDGEYTVFGKVIEGQEVVDKIALEKFEEWDAKNSTVKFSISIIK
jgi:peptidyl-prolyl cis-trans isomerase A (cyclophilin A)